MAAKAKYCATTRRISVTVSPTYLDDQSVPENSHFVWAYHVRIENRGPDTVQLRSRHWRITNARGEVCAAPASWASSRVLSPATSSNTPAACRSRRRQAS